MDKQYHIKLNNQTIPVNEEVYRAYMRPRWREKKSAQVRADVETSLFSLAELSGDKTVEDVVMEKYLQERLASALAELSDIERKIICGSYIENKTDRQLGSELRMPHQTVNHRKQAILKRMKNKLKKFL